MSCVMAGGWYPRSGCAIMCRHAGEARRHDGSCRGCSQVPAGTARRRTTRALTRSNLWSGGGCLLRMCPSASPTTTSSGRTPSARQLEREGRRDRQLYPAPRFGVVSYEIPNMPWYWSHPISNPTLVLPILGVMQSWPSGSSGSRPHRSVRMRSAPTRAHPRPVDRRRARGHRRRRVAIAARRRQP